MMMRKSHVKKKYSQDLHTMHRLSKIETLKKGVDSTV